MKKLIKKTTKKHVLAKNELNEISKKVEAISTKGLTKDLISKYSILNGAKYFSSGILQNYLVFIAANKHFKCFSGTTNGISEKSIENKTTSANNFAPTFIDTCPLSNVNFNGHCLINKIPDYRKVINLYISYTLHTWSRDLNIDFTLNNCLFESVKLI